MYSNQGTPQVTKPDSLKGDHFGCKAQSSNVLRVHVLLCLSNERSSQGKCATLDPHSSPSGTTTSDLFGVWQVRKGTGDTILGII